MKRDHPCAKDCPMRSPDCRVDCDAWKAYEAKRNADYIKEHRQRVQQALADRDSVDRAVRIKKTARRWSKYKNKYKSSG